MSKIDRAWIDEQIAREMERGRYAEPVYNLAALLTVRDCMFGDEEHKNTHHDMTREEAEKWVNAMEDPEGKPLKPIPMGDIQHIAANYGAKTEEDTLKLWVVANMMKSDYLDVGEKYAGNAVDFYAALARDWLRDKDAVKDKLVAYKKYIVKHSD